MDRLANMGGACCSDRAPVLVNVQARRVPVEATPGHQLSSPLSGFATRDSCEVGPEPDRFAEMADCLVHGPQVDQCCPEITVAFGMIGLKRQGGPIGVDGAIKLPEHQNAAARVA